MKDLKGYIKEGLFDDIDEIEGKNSLEYNTKQLEKDINDDENYVYVDDISYIDIIREIDEGIGRRRIREINK